MATYLQGVTDYIPQVQPFSPDYNFYSGALDLKQSKYDAARKNLSNLYGSLLNAPLTRQDNAEQRDKFFKTIEQDIQKMATVDLSLRQNQEMAQGVFNQMLDNDGIRKDMVWTRNFQNQVTKSNSFKNCTEGEKCGGQWWEGGDRLLEYSKKKFQMADAQSALSMANASYVPAQDVTKMALKLAKEADLNVSQDKVTGQWITTTTNGPLVVEPLSNLLKGSIAKDGKVQEYYKAQAQLQRQDFTYANVDQYGSVEAAEQAYIQQMTPVADKLLGKSEEIDSTIENNESKKEKVESKIKESTPGDQSTLADVYDDLEKRGNAYNATKESTDADKNIIQVAKNNQRYSAAEIDSLYASYQLEGDINSTAATLAFKDYKTSVKANPYGVEAVKHRNRVALENLQQQHALEKIDYEAAIDMEMQDAGYGSGGTKGTGVTATGGADHNQGKVISDLTSTTDIGSTDNLSMDKAASGFNRETKKREGIRADLSNGERVVTQKMLEATRTAAINGDAQAKEDYIAMAENYAAAMQEGEETVKDQNKGYKNNIQVATDKMNAKLLARKLAEANTTEEKYAIVQRMEKNKIFDINKLPGSTIDYLYEKVLEPMYNMKDKANPVLRDYLKTTWEATGNMRGTIKAKNLALEQFDKHYAEEAEGIASAVRSQGAEGISREDQEFWGDAVEAYVDENGHINDEETFVSNMMGLGDYTEDQVREIYRGDRKKEVSEASFGEQAGAFFEGGAELALDALEILPLGIPKLIRYATADEGDEIMHSESMYDNLNEDAIGGKAMPGIHDFYKRVYSDYAEPSKDSSFLQLQGINGETALAKQFALDSAAYKSIATKGSIGFLTDALDSDDASYSFGGLDDARSVENPLAKQIAKQALYDLKNNKKGKRRINGEVTYSNIAQNDANLVAINIKLPNDYVTSFDKGTKDDPGLYRKAGFEKLTNEGITIVVPKAQTTNLFTEGSKKSDWEYVMDVQGEIDYDIYPKYTKDMKLVSRDGQYVVEGSVMNGLDENGMPQYRTLQSMPTGNNLNASMTKLDELIRTIVTQNQAIEKNYVLNNK